MTGPVIEPGAPTGSVHAFRLARGGSLPPETAPAAARPLTLALAWLDALLDRAYGSRWNPAHQSGPLAVATLLVVIVSGTWLLLFYRIGSPYESLLGIQANVAGARWLRALHRYASDVAVLCVALHALRMLAAGRTWGTRVLAWVSGLVLTGAMLVVGWTGYVLAWDAHGQMLGAAGARLLDFLQILATPIGRIFAGGESPTGSFFFLNLFVHMALPLGMAALLWIHTLRLARSRWLPDRPLLVWSNLALVALSLALPAGLGAGSDGLTLGDRGIYDLFYTAWIPLALRLSPAVAWACVLALVLVPLSVPAWWRPSRARRGEPSQHNPAACTGCGQCALDCPFEAISMVPGTSAHGPAELALVNVARCVSCGLCAGSCDQLAIGPSDRDGHAQTHALRKGGLQENPAALALVHCAHGQVGYRLAERARQGGHAVVLLEVDCAGALHALAVSQLTDRFRGVMVLGCPPHRCRSREGVGLGLARILEGREPELKHPLDLTRVRFASGGSADLGALSRELESFAQECGRQARPEGFFAGAVRSVRGRLAAAGLTAAMLLAVAGASQLRLGHTPAHGAVRLAWRLPGQSWQDCRPLSAAEQASLPAHMRQTQDCRTVYLDYRLRVWLDGALVVDRRVSPPGARGDRPLYVEQDLPASPGTHRVGVEFVPVSDPKGTGARLVLQQEVEVQPGRARLVYYKDGLGALQVR